MDYPSLVDTENICAPKCRFALSLPLRNDYDKKITFIMMNPSNGDMAESDGTIDNILSMCEKYEDRFQIGTITIVNLFPLCVSDSKQLHAVFDNIKDSLGEDLLMKLTDLNNEVATKFLKEATYVVLAWGGVPKDFDANLYKEQVNALIRKNCLAEKHDTFTILMSRYSSVLTQENYPRHPSPRNGKPLMLVPCTINESLQIETLGLRKPIKIVRKPVKMSEL